MNSASPAPWRTLSLGPAVNANQLPDWLLLDLFSMAYDSTHLSQTQGKLNLNTEIYPFGFHRKAPLKSLLNPAAENATTDADTIVADIASYDGIQSGPCSGLPADMYVYPGQICQAASLPGTGTNQWQREALIRDIAGLVITQCSDFQVHVVAQALNAHGKVAAEQRLTATVSRVVDVGPDGVPATEDDMAGPDRLVGTADDLTFRAADGSTITKLLYDGNDKPLEQNAGRPPFHYRVTQTEILNP